MTDGFPQAPQPVRAIDPAQPTRTGDRVQVVDATGDLKNHATREALTGEVTAQNKDGSTTIHTDKGDVTVVIRSRDKLPEGTRVIVDLPAGNPPRQATVSPAPPQPAQATQTTSNAPVPQPARTDAPPEADTDAAHTAPQPRLDPKTTEELTRQQAQASAPAPPPEDVPLQPDDLVRLLPLPPGEPVDRGAAAAKVIAEQAVLNLPLAALEVFEGSPQPSLGQLPGAPALPAAELPYGAAAPPVSTLLPGSLSVQQPPALPPLLVQRTQSELQTPREFDLPPTLLFGKLGTLGAGPEALPLKIAGTIATGAANPAIKPAGIFDIEVKTVSPPPVKIGNETIAAVLPKGIAGQGTGTVAGLTAKGLPVLSVALPGSTFPQEFIIQTRGPAGLVPGSEIGFVPRPAAATQTILPIGELGLPQLDAAGIASWPAMQELLGALQQTTPQALQALAKAAPNAASPDKIPAAALLFIAAARAGDIAGWLGEKTTDALRRAGKAGLIEKLTGDVDGSARTAGDRSSAGDWKAVNLPMFYDSEAQRLALYYRHDRGGQGGGEEGDGKRGTRFIFDLSLSRMGPVQLDGLHRNEKLDLIVRTHTRLSPEMQKAMRSAYIDALENTGITGEIAFQNKLEQWVKIDARSGRLGVNT